MDKLINYLKDSRAELTHVSWPTRRQTIAHTAIVVAATLFVAGFIAIFDYGFAEAIRNFLLH
ncbi:MAG TPA: preprotein translocase subunit SecE [Candidatus Paceibacterota bacterium]|nr:preprotein translocase subunit SecE [Candidatus Paceibacterota bacterium]